MGFKTEEVKVRSAGGVRCDTIISVPDSWTAGVGIGAIFAHGMANDLNHPVIKAVCETLGNRGVLTVRFNFSYRQQGKKRPSSDRRVEADYRAQVKWLREHDEFRPAWLVLGGKSLGARVAATIATNETVDPAGLIYLGFPLHAPGREDKLRSEPLIKAPVRQLFIEGDRDPFCRLDLLEKVIEEISPQASLHVVRGGDHSFELGKNADRDQSEVYHEISEICAGWLLGAPGF